MTKALTGGLPLKLFILRLTLSINLFILLHQQCAEDYIASNLFVMLQKKSNNIPDLRPTVRFTLFSQFYFVITYVYTLFSYLQFVGQVLIFYVLNIVFLQYNSGFEILF